MSSVPRCSHGQIILGCPDQDCPEQNEYLREREKCMDAWWSTQYPRRFPKDSDAYEPSTEAQEAP